MASGPFDDDDDDDDDPDRFEIEYECPECGYEWEDTWSSPCDDDCPECGTRHIQPMDYHDTLDSNDAHAIKCLAGASAWNERNGDDDDADDI